MRYLIISDIHANLEAFEAVIAAAESERVDRRIFLGDVVGYGPEPDDCFRRLEDWADIRLTGNHDYAVLGLTDITYFNPVAKQAVLWTRANMQPENQQKMGRLHCHEYYDSLCLVHSSPYQPEEWHYIFTVHQAQTNFEYFSGQLCFIGHSHIPIIIEQKPTGEIVRRLQHRYILSPESRYIINVGSVGQPRDNDPRSCYMVYDSEAGILEYKRIPYPVTKTQEKILQAGLPEFLAYRLGLGY